MISEVYNVDCLEYMRGLPDKFFELAVVDPPFFEGVADKNFYGADVSKTGVKRLSSISNVWDKGIPKRKYYKELCRVSKEQIIFGINYFNFGKIPVGRIIWDKKNESSTFSNCEIALCSLIESVKIFRYTWNGMLQADMKNKEQRIHPTQKPVALYRWILENYAKPNDKIFDSHMGSQSSRIAAWQMGFDYYGCELDTDYFIEGNKRFEREKMKQQLFTPEQVRATQTKLL